VDCALSCLLFTSLDVLFADFRNFLTVTLADVVDGTYDLRIPRLVALVTSVTPSASGDWVVELQVPELRVCVLLLTKPRLTINLHLATGPNRKYYRFYIC